MSVGQQRVVVLMGGWTSEAAVSRVSASFCAKAARLAGWDVIELEFDKHAAAKLVEIAPDRVFNALHGRIGEDGSVQGMLNILNIPYTHSGVLASSMAMDKITSRLMFQMVGIAVPELLAIEEDTHVYPRDFSGAHVIKPRNDGSSFGVVIVQDGDDAPERNLWETDCKLMAEEYIPGRELSVSVIDGRALCVTEIKSQTDFYDFEAKYQPGGSEHILPADIPEETTALAMEWAERAFAILGCRGVARADFRWDEEEDGLYMLEVNTQPGMTATSLVPEQAAYCGISGEALVNHLLEGAQCDE